MPSPAVPVVVVAIISEVVPAIAIIVIVVSSPQRRHGPRGDVAAAGRVGEPLERVGQADELGVVPRAAQQLEVDRLPVVVDARRNDDGRDAVRRARRVAAAEAALPARRRRR